MDANEINRDVFRLMVYGHALTTARAAEALFPGYKAPSDDEIAKRAGLAPRRRDAEAKQAQTRRERMIRECEADEQQRYGRWC